MDHNTTSKGILSGMFWKYAERFSAQGISFLISIILARLLFPDEYGVVALIIVFITIADVFMTSGLSTALIQKKDANETDFSTIFYITLILAIIIYLILYFSSPFIANFYGNSKLSIYLRVFSIKILISSYNSIQHAYVSRHMMFKKFFFSTIIGTIISGIVGIWMAYAGFGPWAIIAQYLTNAFIDMIVLRITIPWRPKWLFSLKSAKTLSSFGWKVLVADLFGKIFDNLRSLLIGRYYTPADLAYYNRGKQFPSVIGSTVITTLGAVLFPVMSNFSDKPKKIKEITRRSIKTTSFLIFPIMIFFIAAAKPLIIFLITDKWIESVIFLQVLSASQVFSTVSTANIQATKALGRSDVTLKLELIKKPIYLIILIVSLYYGILAVAISMLIYSVVGTLINMVPNRKLLGYKFSEQFSDITQPFLFSIVMFIVIVPFNFLVIPNIIIILLQFVFGFVTYIGLSKVFRNDSFYFLVGLMRNYLKGKER